MLTFEDLYETYAAELYRFAFWLSGDGAEAEDITSETFIRAWTHREPIRTETLKAYLFTIARNVYLGQRRKRKREAVLDESLPRPDPAPGPEEQYESRMELARVQAFLQTLPEVDRAAFVLRVQHELSYAEIARTLDLSLTAAKVKVHRVRKRLLAMRADEEVE